MKIYMTSSKKIIITIVALLLSQCAFALRSGWGDVEYINDLGYWSLNKNSWGETFWVHYGKICANRFIDHAAVTDLVVTNYLGCEDTILYYAEKVGDFTAYENLRSVRFVNLDIPATNDPKKWPYIDEISEKAFEGCAFLAALEIPRGVRKIGARAFADCEAMRHLEIGPDVELIGAGAFENTPNLKDVEFMGPPPEGVEDSFVLSNDPTVVYPDSFAVEWRAILFKPIVFKRVPDSATVGADGIYMVNVELSKPANGYSVRYALKPEGPFVDSLKVSDGVIAEKIWFEIAAKRYESVTNVVPVKKIVDRAFWGRKDLTNIIIPNSVENIGEYAFSNCPNLKSIMVSASPTPDMATYAFGGVADILDVPANLKAQWDKYIFEIPSAVEVKSNVRATDPGVIDIEYMVKSAYSKAKTRILAFENGEREFVSMLRPEAFIDDTAKNIGDGIDTFVWHKVSWQATADWGIDLAKVKVEILAKDMSEGLLSFHTVTIPAMNGRPKMIVGIDGRQQMFEAIYWSYADVSNNLRLENGKIYDGQTLLAEQWGPKAYSMPGASAYVYGKMGYSMLSEEDAKYVRDLLRITCYAGTPYKVVEE